MAGSRSGSIRSIEPGQTSECVWPNNAGRWLIESVATDWAGAACWCGTLSNEENKPRSKSSLPSAASRRAVVVAAEASAEKRLRHLQDGPLVLIDVETDQGVTGHTYIFAYSKMTLSRWCI
jgi:hypothetical protein